MKGAMQRSKRAWRVGGKGGMVVGEGRSVREGRVANFLRRSRRDGWRRSAG